MSKEVQKKGEQALATYDFGGDAGAGFENQTQEDVTLPFLKILEGLSPEVARKKGEGGVEGARPGMLFNTVSEQLYGDEGLVVIPVYTEHVFVEWKPRKQGGGFVAVHTLDSPVVKDAKAQAKDFGSFSTKYDEKSGEPCGNDLIETFYMYALDEATAMPLVIAFTSTRISAYKKWNSKVNMFQVQTPDGRKQKPPLWAHRTRVGTSSQSNAEGTWSTFTLAPAEGDFLKSLIPPSDPRYQAGKDTLEIIKAGFARVNHAAVQSSGRPSGDPAPQATGDVPF